MASLSSHSTPEHWTELIAARKQRLLCSQQVDAIKTSCKTRCGKRNITECAPCYGKALEQMRKRYVESGEREWFTQRKAFLQELDGLFTDAKRSRRSVTSIEARIESEKEAWYRWVLRRHPEFLAVRDGGLRQDELRGMLDDPDRSREKMVGMMWQGIGEPPDWAERVDSLAERVTAVGRNEVELKKLYIHEFFLDQKTGEVLRNARLYLDDYEANPGLSLEEVVGRIASSTHDSRRVQPQREAHKIRLDDLKRAKTAFELNKAQAKGRAKAREATPGLYYYDLPTCLVCDKPANVNDVISCSVCQIVAQMGDQNKFTVYCSKECYEIGHEHHVETEHDCEADGRCVQLFDEDVVMENEGFMGTYACRECFQQKQSAVFCSKRCAFENITEHRHRRHGLRTIREYIPDLVVSLKSAVRSILHNQNHELKIKLNFEAIDPPFKNGLNFANEIDW